MPTHDYSLANQSGASFRTDLNNALAAIQSNNSNSSSPATTVAYQWWADTNAAIMKIRNSSNNAWINLFTLAGGIDVDAASNFNEDVTFTGASANVVFDKSQDQFEFADNAKACFGNSNDLVISHDGANSRINNLTGTLFLQTSSGSIKLIKDTSENMIAANVDGAAELYFDNSLKLATDSNGITITGRLLMGDSSGANDDRIRLGASGDLSLYHDSTNSVISNNTGVLYYLAATQQFMNFGGTETMAKFSENSSVQLYFDNDKHFQTTSDGVEVDGELMIDPDAGGTLKFTGASAHTSKFIIADNGGTGAGNMEAEFGDGSDIFTIASNGNIRIAEAVTLAPNAKVAIAHGGSNPRGLEVHSTGSGFQGITLMSVASRNTTNHTYRHFQCVINGVADKLRVADDGDVTNTNNSYGAISDERLKENIVDASSQWDDIKALRIRKFNYKSLTDPEQRPMLGVVAQEAELVCPNLVISEVTLQEGVEQEYKSFKYSVLYMKAIKCLQEAQAKIETLETKVAALEAA